jgi:hypothetical protein
VNDSWGLFVGFLDCYDLKQIAGFYLINVTLDGCVDDGRGVGTAALLV